MKHSPAHLGFRLPAEWEPHVATWIAWPHQRSDWPGKFAAIPFVYVEIVRHLHQAERVCILVNDAGHERQARLLLQRGGIDLQQIDFCRVPTDRVWTRDSGPIFVVNEAGTPGLLDWHFNAWAKYDNWKRDDLVPDRIQAVRKCRSWQPRLGRRRVVLEGGSIDGNGLGSLLTTEECLLSDRQQRNPGFTHKDYEEVFATYLGVHKTLWLGQGIVGDDTHGHVDDLARFVGPRTIVAAVEDDPRDDNYSILQENLERLQGMTDQKGRKLEVVSLPMPAPVYWQGQRLPASYANFYIANDRVLVPTFNDAADRQALGILAELLPRRQVVGIACVDLVWGLGTLHCLTQQEPLGGKGSE